ncbi:energy transducer TonB [Loktanella sp. D2R18]|uniref:energy transducer TonB n=1 Tax=Rhodobacterales TaxID=204455 RepID=UPI000DEB366F|nr:MULTISPECIES: energy transducer TonB [Rhodobacterales]MDO6590087.1 energy transducer TonB [Yoonia sp. 1_MG-2023]RBW45788.1 energy transducer TonB [Loktanella sp. D2R18]
MRTPGTYISATGHVALIGWLFFGWGFNADPLDFDAMDVSVISGEAFEELRAARTPEPGEADPTAPVQPEIDDTPPPPPSAEDPAEHTPPPDPVDPPDDELPPPPPPEMLVTEAEDTPPETPDVPESLPSSPNVDVNAEPAPTQAPRVATVPTAPPPPDAQIDDTVREVVVPDETTTADVPIEDDTPTAPEVTATEIAIEDEKPSGLVETSLRPVSRPSRPTPPAPEPDTPTETAEAPTEVETPSDDAVEAALAAALAAEAPAVAVGPALTSLEESSFRLAISACWNVNTGSQAANVVVEVGFSLDANRRVVGNDVELISSSGGDEAATRTAFDAARRAILRCSVERGGYNLPSEKFEHWKDIVITFDPSQMRLR